jgi:tRNA A-37 threonylcarbamoyl transferase component Bud32
MEKWGEGGKSGRQSEGQSGKREVTCHKLYRVLKNRTMTDMNKQCARCGGPLNEGTLQGLCARCLLGLNLSVPTEVVEEGGSAEAGSAKAPPPPAPPVEEIARLFPQLEILECLGRGGMGAVYKARQAKLDRLVALKILLRRQADGTTDVGFAERFGREARALARLNHPDIVTVYEYGEAGGFPYLVMEYVDGVTLRQSLRHGKLTPEQALAIVPKVCEALQFAHQQGVVHRDIKPENILLDKQGRVKIADFGIAKILAPGAQNQNLTGGKDVVGTPHYMAPEQIEHPQTVDHRADIYSLGVVFYELLTGELPLGKFQPPSKKVHVDVRLDEIVLRALEKEPERRYQQASDVKSDVETLVASPVKTQTPAATAEPGVSRAYARAGIAVDIILAVLLGVVGWGVYNEGVFFNALFVFILLMVVVRVGTIIWHLAQRTLECGLWRRPLARELRWHWLQVANRWTFWLLAVVVLGLCIVPAQFTHEEYALIRTLDLGGVGLLLLLELLPGKRIWLATNCIFAVGSVFMLSQIARIYWPPATGEAVTLAAPFRGEWLVVHGGRSGLLNAHHGFVCQRDALDLERLVDGHERTGSERKLESYPSWNEVLYAPAAGKVVKAVNDQPDLAVGEMDPGNPAGNHVVLDLGNGRFVLMAHLQQGSVLVVPGDQVHVGQALARCGNSGNTSQPHLHLQVQSQVEIFGKGTRTYPIVFREASLVRAGQTRSETPFAVRRNDHIVCAATGESPANGSGSPEQKDVYTQSQELDLHPDGSAVFRMTADLVNQSQEPWETHGFRNSDFVNVTNILDGRGRRVAFETTHEKGHFQYTLQLNEPVKPGEKLSLTTEGTMTGLVTPTGAPGEFEYTMRHWPSSDERTRRVEVHRLPPGAVVRYKEPGDLQQRVRNGRVELFIDRLIPNGDSLEIIYRYRLGQVEGKH